MSDFRIRPLHRQRRGRRRPADVLNQTELAELLQVPLAAVQKTLDAMNWPYHKDSTGGIWARPPDVRT